MSKKIDRSKTQAKNYDSFTRRHIGTSEETSLKMLNDLGPHHIANLGHGVYPDTPLDNVKVFVDTIKSYKY